MKIIYFLSKEFFPNVQILFQVRAYETFLAICNYRVLSAEKIGQFCHIFSKFERKKCQIYSHHKTEQTVGVGETEPFNEVVQFLFHSNTLGFCNVYI